MTQKQRIEKAKKDAIKVAAEICALIEENEFTIQSCIESKGVPKRTFYSWVDKYPEVEEMFEAARAKGIEKKKKELVSLAYAGIKTLLMGKEWEETTREIKRVGAGENKNAKGGTEKNEGKKAVIFEHIKTVKKFIMPNPPSCIFILKALGGFIEKQEVELSGQVGNKLTIEVVNVNSEEGEQNEEM